MSRVQKIHKLANAIRRYRGISQFAQLRENRKWLVPPDHAALNSVIKWLSALGLDIHATILIIDGFQTVDQFSTWLKNLEKQT